MFNLRSPFNSQPPFLDDFPSDNSTKKVAFTMGCALIFGVGVVYASLKDNQTVWPGLLWAGAWSSVGWFLGFIFGIPRYLSTDTARTPGAPGLETAKQALAAAEDNANKLRVTADDAADKVRLADLAAVEAAKAAAQAAETKAKQAETAAEAARKNVITLSAHLPVSSSSSLSVNTNLEQISDWLTKIIVGVSLVESQTLLNKMHVAATYMAKSMVGTGAAAAKIAENSPTVAPVAAPAAAASSTLATANSLATVSPTESFAYAVMLYFLVTGLLGSYLLTRLFLQRALDDAAKRAASIAASRIGT